MASEYSSIARPYSEAAFKHATEKDNLGDWAEMLAFMSAAVSDETLRKYLSNPALDTAQKEKLMLDIGESKLTEEAKNFIRLLVVNKRLEVLPEIAEQFEALKNAKEGAIEVVITSAYAMDDPQQQQIIDALKKKFNSEINVTVELDDTLLGGIKIRAGDEVIDGSIKGQLHKLANELGI